MDLDCRTCNLVLPVGAKQEKDDLFGKSGLTISAQRVHTLDSTASSYFELDHRFDNQLF